MQCSRLPGGTLLQTKWNAPMHCAYGTDTNDWWRNEKKTKMATFGIWISYSFVEVAKESNKAYVSTSCTCTLYGFVWNIVQHTAKTKWNDERLLHACIKHCVVCALAGAGGTHSKSQRLRCDARNEEFIRTNARAFGWAHGFVIMEICAAPFGAVSKYFTISTDVTIRTMPGGTSNELHACNLIRLFLFLFMSHRFNEFLYQLHTSVNGMEWSSGAWVTFLNWTTDRFVLRSDRIDGKSQNRFFFSCSFEDNLPGAFFVSHFPAQIELATWWRPWHTITSPLWVPFSPDLNSDEYLFETLSM